MEKKRDSLCVRERVCVSVCEFEGERQIEREGEREREGGTRRKAKSRQQKEFE